MTQPRAADTPASAEAALAASLSQLRRRAAASSLQLFAQIYLGHYFKDPPSPLHLDLFQLLDEATRNRGARLAVAAPRGHAKSTIVSVAHALRCICQRQERFIVLFSDTADQAQSHLAAAKKELEDNALLRADYPEACELPGVRPAPRRWRKNDVISRNGVQVTALGAAEKIRGRRNREHRPSLIILDDVEHEQLARSEEQRAKLWSWLTKAVAYAGDAGTNIVVVGTIVHYDSLLARLLDPRKSPGWVSRKHQALVQWPERMDLWEEWAGVYNSLNEHDGLAGPAAARSLYESQREEMDAGAIALWPQREDLYTLMKIRQRDGRAAFDSEKQNEPVNPDECFFQDSDFHYWEDQFSSLDELLSVVGRRGTFYGACDPSLGKAGRGRDDSAIVSLLRDDENGVLYVVDADIRRRRPDQTIDDVIAYHRLRDYSLFTIETNQFQDFLADELIKRSAMAAANVPVEKVNHTSDKLGRIQSLQPLVTSGTLRFSRRHAALLDQLRRFPLAAHDDGPDALQMAVAVSQEAGRVWALCIDADGDDAAEMDNDEDMWWSGAGRRVWR